MENLRMEHRHGWHLSDPFLHLTSGPVSAHLPPLSSASPPPEKCSIFSFPLSVLSGPRASPLVCKSESEESLHLDFVSLARNRDEPARNAKEAVSALKDRLHRLSLNGSKRGGGIPQGISCEEGSVLAMVVKEEQRERANIPSLQEDEGIGLKLGKRIYYEDAGGDEGAKQAENSSGSSKSGSSSSTTTTTTTNNNNTLINKNGGLRKKHKGSSGNVAPKCLVEGCNTDLSGVKDYHRRHKVCERHSKASVSKVAGLEQRFCQQCSRFHVLSEFDEGKRSCRRRLAGHNERRRKPPPEPIPLLSAGTLAYLAEKVAGEAGQSMCVTSKDLLRSVLLEMGITTPSMSKFLLEQMLLPLKSKRLLTPKSRYEMSKDAIWLIMTSIFWRLGVLPNSPNSQ